MTYTQKEFLRLLHNKEPICFINNKKVVNLQTANQNNGKKELHYIPNSGGLKDKDIHTFNTYFIDLDCGRDKHKNYYSLDIVSKFKKQKLKELSRFHPTPSSIVETRNGLHVYWFIKDTPTLAQWKNIVDHLVNKFDADVKVKNPAKQMRLPCTLWVKKGYNPFYCEILKLEPLYYTVFDFLHHFEEDTQKAQTKTKLFMKKPLHSYIRSNFFDFYNQKFLVPS